MAKVKNQTSLPDNAASSATSYDTVPYLSYPLEQTNPLLLQAIGKLFGLAAPAPESARILEIGCASGANILSIASNYPKSQCVGIDYSLKQIEAGRDEIKAVGVTNLELKHMSVTDVTKSFGIFDYIICHGVMSWVAPEVQEKILEVCKFNLAPDGIAFVSYNTLPGWNSVRSIRDMMLYHTARFSDVPTKVQQARLLLKFMSDSTKDSKNLLSSAVEREIQIINSHPDYYLLHDHLEENNTAFYFHEFMTKAQGAGLQYLADTNIELMYSENLPADTAKVLAMSDDIVRTEQYMDFINDRRFRQTLLCHNDRILNRNVTPEVLREGYVVSRFSYPEGLAEHNLLDGPALDFQGAGGLKLSSNDPATLAMLQVFLEQKHEAIRVNQLAKLVKDKLKKAKVKLKDDAEASLEQTLCFILMRVLFIGGIYFYADTMPYVTKVSSKPVASKLARHQAKKQEWVSNQRQECKSLTFFDRALVEYLDGTNDTEALVECLLPHFASKSLVFNQSNAPVEDMAVIKKSLPGIITERLGLLCDMAMLIK